MGKIVIRLSLSWARLKGEETRARYFPPKTKAGRRTISIPALLVADLKRWKLQCPISDKDLGPRQTAPHCRSEWCMGSHSGKGFFEQRLYLRVAGSNDPALSRKRL